MVLKDAHPFKRNWLLVPMRRVHLLETRASLRDLGLKVSPKAMLALAHRIPKCARKQKNTKAEDSAKVYRYHTLIMMLRTITILIVISSKNSAERQNNLGSNKNVCNILPRGSRRLCR